ncbi:hypothetical protein IHV10_07265 [Fictibacillus sp. 5RED26]|uniref:hypothetical protein n=1 Tax=Fictibacillus sp. 5RED26 TaxID=2745876 RepID=UPI0018CCD079|nr:hypothetical protein [Fictibacillus sp. 5RED26]MBH0156159.1 hypothetical protein [Fictibacillus sp. 5RED26]
MEDHCDIHKWAEYRPFEQHYETFEPHVVYTANKIIDVYYTFASARSYLSDYECEEFGQIITEHDEIHINFLRSKYLQAALAHYNYAIDLSWQVLWFYTGDNSYLFMEKPKLFEKYSTLCTEKRLYFKLRINKMDDIKEHISEFFNSDLTQEVRETYNYVKHRGSLHTDEISREHEYYMMSYTENENYFLPRMLTRRKFNLEEFKDILIDFDISFSDYFQQIIKWTMPYNYIETKFNMFNCIPRERMKFHFYEMENYEKLFNEHIKLFYSNDIDSINQNPNKYIKDTNLVGAYYNPRKFKNI